VTPETKAALEPWINDALERVANKVKKIIGVAISAVKHN
jgi:hypothetical protein